MGDFCHFTGSVMELSESIENYIGGGEKEIAGEIIF